MTFRVSRKRPVGGSYETLVTIYRVLIRCRARGRRLWRTRGCANETRRAGAARRR